MKFENVTVVISATDETVSLKKTVDFIMNNCSVDDIGCVLIVVPEDVTEECKKIIGLLTVNYPDVVRMLIQTKPGVGGALQDSVDFTDTSHILFFSADMPTSPDIIPLLIEKSKREPQKIYKISRWLVKNSFDDYGYFKLIINYLGQKFIRLLYQSQLTDFTVPILIGPSVIYKNIIFLSTGFSCLAEAVLIPCRIGVDIVEVPAKCLSRDEGISKNSYRQIISYLKTVLKIRFVRKSRLIKS